MQYNFTLKRAWLGLNKTLSAFLLLCFLGGTINAQTYVNSNLSTGATATGGTAAPAGTTWSELQPGSGTFGVGASITNGIRLADDFVVPAGNTWNLTSMTFYGYQTGFAGATSPFTTIRVSIHSGSVTGPVVFGDQTTNRFASSSDALMFRIANATPSTTRRIWAINATTVVTLPAGTYWIEYATDVTGGVAHFLPVGTVVGTTTQPGNNAQQNTGAAWAPLLDGTFAQDMPFRINYTSGPVTPCLGTPAPGNTLTTNAAVCPGTGFTLSLQNATPGSGVTYQWQSSPTIGGPYTPVVPAQTNANYTVASITATTFYQAAVTCGGNSATSTPVQVALNPPSACYCASTATDLADEDIFNVTVGTLNNSSTCATTAPGSNSVKNLYSNYTGYTGAPTGNISRGLSNSLSIQIGTCGTTPYGNGTAVFIDYNQNGLFTDAGERVYGLATTTPGAHFETGTFVVPVTATPGVTRMRVITVEFSAGTAINPCGTYTWGETEDYNITIVVPPACTGAPAPGNTLSTATSVCAGATAFTLSLQNNPVVSGLTYQWFSSPTVTGTFTAITGATASTYSLSSISTATCYYAAVTCSGVTTNSSTLCIALNPFTQCYCIPGATSCTANDVITNVTIAGLNNNSTCSTGPPAGYSNFTSLTAGTLVQGVNNNISVTATNGGTEYAGVWVDFDQNGIFSASEFKAIGSGPGGTFTNTIAVPPTALLGTTRMRVRLRYNIALTGADACIAYNFGETEDYNVNIIPCSNPVITAQPSITNNRCNGNATVSVTVAGPLPNIIWQYRTSSTGLWTNVVNGLNNGPTGITITGVGTSALLLNSIQNNHNGWEFRILYNNPCNTSLDVSNTAILSVLPMLTTVNLVPNPASLCLGNVQTITITNPAIVTPVQVTATSGTINVAIPDNLPAGINNSITFPTGTIPAGATITNVTVTLNAPAHTYASDLVFALKAPNGNVINLDWFISGTGAAGAGLVNTRLSSTASNFLSTGAAPWNGIFRADLAPINAANPTYPTGFLGTGTYFTSWATLLASLPSGNDVSGNWTLGVYDGGPLDVGNLTNWSINVTYTTAPVSAGVFTGAAGTLFTNPAATIAYTGGLINTVYVKPLAIGVSDYVINFTSGNCIASPLTVPITANQTPTGTVSLPAATSLCIGEAKTITVAGAANIVGGPIFHQFQVRPNSTSVWTNVSNGGFYSGATTSALTITNPTVAINNFQFRDSIYTGAGCGFLLTNATTVSVNPKPVVTISAAPIRNLFPGLTTTLTAAVSPNATGASYQWFRNGTAVTGATTNMLLVGIDALGTYTIRVTDANGCQSAAGTSTPGSIVIGDSSNLTRLFIYPSPNNGRFQVRYFNDVANNGLNPGIINVYDAKGSKVFSRNYNVGGGFQAMNVDLGASHGSGIYRVDLLTSTGERIKTGTVIIF